MDLQFENLVLNNEGLIFKTLDISLEEIVFANPYYQTKTTSRMGCQIDYLIQTKYNNVYVCEIKFSKKPIGQSVVHEVEDKIAKLKLPRNFSYRPVLIHVNGITSHLEDRQYFARTIDHSNFLMQDHEHDVDVD